MLNVLWTALSFLSLCVATTESNAMDGSNRVTLIPTPAKLEDGGELLVSWKGMKKPDWNDFIGLSCGPKASHGDFFMKKYVNDHADVSNSVRFPALYTMRCNYLVEYYSHDAISNQSILLANVTVPMKDSINKPKHGHIAFTENDDEMAIMFNSASKSTPQVQYGASESKLDKVTSGTSTTYRASDMCHEPATITNQIWFRDPGKMHKVILKGLRYGKIYYYRFGNDVDRWSPVYSFKSRPDPSVRAIKFIAFGDLGVYPSAKATMKRIETDVLKNGYSDFVLHFGDISYAWGNGHIWDEFFFMIEQTATRSPYMISVGNHEYGYLSGGDGHDPSGAVGPDGAMAFHPPWGNFLLPDSKGECAVPIHHRFHTPKNGHGIFWYSFDYGSVHIIQMSSEHDWTRNSVQYNWIENDLKNVDRSKTPWVILTTHRMMYATQYGEDEDWIVAAHFRKEFDALLWKYKVNLILCGHQHSYERSCPVVNGACTPDGVGPVHIISGAAGARLGPDKFPTDIGNWSVAQIDKWGYVRIDAQPEEMIVKFVADYDGKVYDHATIQKWV